MIAKWKWGLVALLLVFAVAYSYGLAKFGEPQSLWIWRDVLGWIK